MYGTAHSDLSVGTHCVGARDGGACTGSGGCVYVGWRVTIWS